MQALTAPTQILNSVNTMLFKFLWKKKQTNTKAFEKVKRNVVCNTTAEGGIKMINITDMQTSFQLNWINQIQINDNKKWKAIPRYHLNQIGSNLTVLHATVTTKNLKGLQLITSAFWKTALGAWVDYKSLFTKEIMDFLDQPIWNNKHVTYRHKHLFIKRWADSGINRVSDIWQNNTITPCQEIQLTTGQYPAIQFDYNAICTAINTLQNRNNPTHEGTNTKLRPLEKMTAKRFRELLTQNKATTPTSTFFWRQRYNYEIDSNCWLLAYKTTTEERLRLLQWKLLHNIYPTNVLLHKMKIRNNIMCEHCLVEDYVEHFFWHCQQTKPLWRNVENTILRKTGVQIKLTQEIVLLGYKPHKQKEDNNKLINHIILIAKMTISKFKYGQKININFIFESELALRIK